MLLAKKDVTVENMEIGESMTEVLKLRIQRKQGEKRDLIVLYSNVPPKTNA